VRDFGFQLHWLMRVDARDGMDGWMDESIAGDDSCRQHQGLSSLRISGSCILLSARYHS
jgi:hypothetical protein